MINVARGYETDEHREAKAILCKRLMGAGCFAICEHRNSDVVAFHPRTGELICCEVERSPRNFLKNLVRNSMNGAKRHIVIAIDSPTLAKLEAYHARHYTAEKGPKVYFLTLLEATEGKLRELLDT